MKQRNWLILRRFRVITGGNRIANHPLHVRYLNSERELNLTGDNVDFEQGKTMGLLEHCIKNYKAMLSLTNANAELLTPRKASNPYSEY